MNLDHFANLVTAIAWPAVAVTVFLYLRKPLKALLERSKRIKIKIPGGTEIDLSAEEAESIVQDVVEGIDLMLADMTATDKEIIDEIASSWSGDSGNRRARFPPIGNRPTVRAP